MRTASTSNSVWQVKELQSEEQFADLVLLAVQMHTENAPHLSFSVDCIRSYYERLRNDYDRSNFNCFIVYRKDKAVGFFLCALVPYYFSNQLCAEQVLWFVEKDWRGGPAAFLLIQAYEEWARIRGAAEIYTGVSVHGDREKVEKTSLLLEKMGYPRTGYLHCRSLVSLGDKNG